MLIRARRFDSFLTGSLQVVELEVRAGRIARYQPVTTEESSPLPFLGPGLLDIQVNGYGGREFSSPQLTTGEVTSITHAQLEMGVARYCPTVTTASLADTNHGLATIAKACREDSTLSIRIPGIHLEGPYISREDGPRGAHPAAHCRPPDWDEFQRLQEAADGRIRLLTLSPEYQEACDFIRRAVGAGVIVALGHLAATTNQIRSAVDAGARLSTHLGNGAHRELRRHPNYLWDQLAEDRLWASLIVDGHHLPQSVVQSFVRSKTPSRCVLVSDLSGLAGLPPGRYPSQLCDLEILPDGRLVIAGQEQLLAGASLPLTDGIINVIRSAGVDLPAALAMASTNPAQALKLEQSPIDVGQPADFSLFHWQPTTTDRAAGLEFLPVPTD